MIQVVLALVDVIHHGKPAQKKVLSIYLRSFLFSTSEMKNYQGYIIDINKNDDSCTNLLYEINRLVNEENENFWFMRKEFEVPHLRMRFKTNVKSKEIEDFLYTKTENKCNKVIYEPETLLFGGDDGIDIAHEIFCLITKMFCIYMERCEKKDEKIIIFLWVTNYMVNSIASDKFEAWDIWEKVYKMRKFDPGKYCELIENYKESINFISDINKEKFIELYISKYNSIQFDEFLAKLYKQLYNLKSAYFYGKLSCGLRGILSRIIIFCWNIFGFNGSMQGLFSYLFSLKYRNDSLT